MTFNDFKESVFSATYQQRATLEHDKDMWLPMFYFKNVGEDFGVAFVDVAYTRNMQKRAQLMTEVLPQLIVKEKAVMCAYVSHGGVLAYGVPKEIMIAETFEITRRQVYKAEITRMAGLIPTLGDFEEMEPHNSIAIDPTFNLALKHITAALQSNRASLN